MINILPYTLTLKFIIHFWPLNNILTSVVFFIKKKLLLLYFEFKSYHMYVFLKKNIYKNIKIHKNN